ncbi:gastrula zinc finger protein XlCGF57.1-like [Periplaneta americana]|uniref:gastrula zinc finger protein XlCGF57.1-like n=1 Tax=Periplaneta americana TaxID=6978 RepID=UPI0037E82837
MDWIKKESDIDPLAGSSDNTDFEEKPSIQVRRQEGNSSNLDVVRIKEESLDPNCETTSEPSLSATFPVVKCEAEEGSRHVIMVKPELCLEENTEDDGADSVADAVNITQASNSCIAVLDDQRTTGKNTDICSEKILNGNVIDFQAHTVENSFKRNVCKCLVEQPSPKSRGNVVTLESQLKCDMHLSQSVNQNHLETATGKKQLICNVCYLPFTHPTSLRRHMFTHTGEKPFKCDNCDMAFSESGKLVKHIRKHTGEKPYQCTLCSKLFTQSNSLKRHLRAHSGEKPFKCDVCGRCFTEARNLKVHKRQHSGEKPYTCDICGRRFAVSGNLRIHIRLHTGEKPYNCDVCGKNFSLSTSLKRHSRIHKGEKPFQCNVCGVRFTQSASIKRHIRNHTGEKPFSCLVCDRSFSDPTHLKRHVRIHTGEKS